MNLSQLLPKRNIELGLIVMRVVLAALFIFSGISKLFTVEMTTTMFGQLGLAPFWVYAVSIIELLGGLMLLLGLFVQLAAIPLGIIMIAACVVQVKFGSGIMGLMTPLLAFFGCVLFFFSGSSLLALDKLFTKCRCKDMDCKTCKTDTVSKDKACVCTEGECNC